MTDHPVPSGQIKPLQLNSPRKRPLSVLLTAIALAVGSIGFLPRLAQSATPKETAMAQAMLQTQGTLQSGQETHSFAGEAGQMVTISLSSSEFDTYIVLLDPSGTEIAANDDYGRSPNSTIVITLPESGQYQVLASAYSGQGGSYTVSVKSATPFDQAYAKGVQFLSEGRLDEAAGALTEAIQIEPNQPAPYLDRAEVSYAQGNLPFAISNYEQAAILYERIGNSKAASDIRQHLAALQNPPNP